MNNSPTSPLENGRFVFLLVLINLFGMSHQPTVLYVTIACLAGYHFFIGFLHFIRTRNFSNLRKKIKLVLFWLSPWVVASMVFSFIGIYTDMPSALTGLFTPAVLFWIMYYLIAYLRRYRRQKEDSRRWAQNQIVYEQQRLENERLEAISFEAHQVKRARRERAIAKCDDFFLLYAPEISERFPRTKFDEYLKKYMGQERSSEEIEERSNQLLKIMQQHLEKSGKSEKVISLSELASWFVREKRQVDILPIDEIDKVQMIAQLQERFNRLQEQYLRAMQP